MTCTVNDDDIGISQQVTLVAGAAPTVITASAPIPSDAVGSYTNTANVSCTFADFPNELTDEASHEVNLFQPAIELAKTGDALSKIGDPTDYTITLTNNSSEDTPDLEIRRASCTERVYI